MPASASLHERTEGWPAGLRLAAISLAAHPDPERFVSEFSGSERTVAGYLLAEVLERQPPEVRDLLLRTSILERVSGPLADALTGGTGAEAILQRLEDQNAFVTSLDAGRTWFRYHHLFADLLRLELRRTAPATIPSLHRAAAAWHEQEGDVVEAVRHYQAAGDWAPAARLLVDNYLTLTMAGRGETLHALLGAFPADAHLGDGNLAAALAIDSILHGLLDEAAAHFAVARRLAAAAPATDGASSTCTWRSSRPSSPAGAAIWPRLRKRCARLEAALGATARRTSCPCRPEYWALALMNLGIAELWAGHPDEARQHLEDALDRTRRISRPFIEIGCLAHLAIAAPLTGQPLPLALELSERALAIAEEHGWTSQSMTTGAFAMAGMALVRMGRFAEAERHLDARGGVAARSRRPGDRGRAPPRPRHAALRRGALRRSAGGVRARAGPGTAARRRARVHGRRAQPGSPGTGANGRHGVRASRARRSGARNSATAPGSASRSRRWSSKRTARSGRSRRWRP